MTAFTIFNRALLAICFIGVIGCLGWQAFGGSDGTFNAKLSGQISLDYAQAIQNEGITALSFWSDPDLLNHDGWIERKGTSARFDAGRCLVHDYYDTPLDGEKVSISYATYQGKPVLLVRTTADLRLISFDRVLAATRRCVETTLAGLRADREIRDSWKP